MKTLDTPADSPASRTSSALTGGAVLIAAMFLASAGNYALNLILGRWLTPAEFGDVALMVTLMLLTTVLTSSLQIITAKLVAESTDDAAGRMVSHLRRISLRWGLVGAAIFAIVSSPVASALQVADSRTLVVMACGFPLHLRLAVDRGALQGQLSLGRLAATFLAEVGVRIVATVGFLALGLGPLGATVGLNLGFLAALAIVGSTTVTIPAALGTEQRTQLKLASRNIGILLFATTLINNGDVVLSKWLLAPEAAGQYAAIALVGRAVFFFAWSMQQAVVPLVAADKSATGDGAKVERWTIAMTAGVAFALATMAWIFDDVIVQTAFGSEYASMATLLGPYAFATAFFAVANTLATIDVTRDRFASSGVILAGAALQTGAILAAGSSAQGIVQAQVVAMGTVLVATAIVRRQRTPLRIGLPRADRSAVRIVS